VEALTPTSAGDLPLGELIVDGPFWRYLGTWAVKVLRTCACG